CYAYLRTLHSFPTRRSSDLFTAQDTRLPAGFEGPRVFAIVKVGAHRIFSIVLDADPARVTIGQRVRLKPLAVAADPKGNPRWLRSEEHTSNSSHVEISYAVF